MDITINSNRTNFNGWQEVVNIPNPITKYFRAYFNKNSERSRLMLKDIIEPLQGCVKIVPLKSARNTHIYGWEMNPSDSKKYVLFLHGMAQNVTSEQKLYKALIDKDLGVFALDYRGYGSNKKSRFDENLMLKDVNAAYKYLIEQKHINPSDITIIGHSMGGALATIFASKHPDLNSLILISPITNLCGINSKFLHNKPFGLGVPDKINDNMFMTGIIGMLSSLRLNALSKVKNLDVPTYVIQSRNDSITPCANARLFANRARQKGCLRDFIMLTQGGHNIDTHKVDVIAGLFDKINA